MYICHELAELTLNPPEGIIAGPINEENFFEWEALITWVSLILFFQNNLIVSCAICLLIRFIYNVYIQMHYNVK